MKRKFLLTTALALCLCSCAGSIGPSVSHSGTGQGIIEGTLAENEVLYVYAQGFCESYCLCDEYGSSYYNYITADYEYNKTLKYSYTYNSLVIETTHWTTDPDKIFYYGNDITIKVHCYNINQPSEE